MPGSAQSAPQESRRGQMLTAARNLLHAATRQAAPTTTPPPSSGDRRFEWAMIAVCSWFLGGSTSTGGRTTTSHSLRPSSPHGMACSTPDSWRWPASR
jgi:hypothetical protein